MVTNDRISSSVAGVSRVGLLRGLMKPLDDFSEPGPSFMKAEFINSYRSRTK